MPSIPNNSSRIPHLVVVQNRKVYLHPNLNLLPLLAVPLQEVLIETSAKSLTKSKVLFLKEDSGLVEPICLVQ
jgi:hypothetical protein